VDFSESTAESEHLEDLNAWQFSRFKHWLSSAHADNSPSSNLDGLSLPFQRWFKFKEAFSPRLVLSCLNGMTKRPRVVLDPFGGCGTTGLTCQFVGIEPVLIEVNPFIADLAEAKLAQYETSGLRRSYEKLNRLRVALRPNLKDGLAGAPSTLVEPGVKGRWVYPRAVARQILAFRRAIDQIEDPTHRRLFRVVLASQLVRLSNVVVNGKGRKYRNSWLSSQKSAADVDDAFHGAYLNAVRDIVAYGDRAMMRFKVLRGSCLELAGRQRNIDAAIFSPPYPNSFDYTDIYNLELWMLGYLRSKRDNVELRNATLRSHVQSGRSLAYKIEPPKLLTEILKQLTAHRHDLWDRRLPEMVGAYFADLSLLLRRMRKALNAGGDVFINVADSSYAGIRVPSAQIVSLMAATQGYRTVAKTEIRRMRLSAQQGGDSQLREHLLHLTKTA
jgi:hypothetical protein